ncbi:50S ribosomal protein L6 [Candidatus Hodgkinia cicadicola]|nr:MAG: 50S ribosomal protein L6 [Candidatus Hodgkinia cicadicola]PIM96689.1 50S ribosomal protein L6 [Candidatus Hodgkinia cicadicola]
MLFQKNIKFYLHDSNVGILGLIGNNVLNNHVFIKHNCVVICSHVLRFQLSKLINNFKGIKHGHIKWMIIRSIGYKISKCPNNLEIKLGFSHAILLSLKEPTISLVISYNKFKMLRLLFKQSYISCQEI